MLYSLGGHPLGRIGPLPKTGWITWYQHRKGLTGVWAPPRGYQALPAKPHAIYPGACCSETTPITFSTLHTAHTCSLLTQ